MRTQNGKEIGIETERIKMWINKNKKLNSIEKTKVKTVFFYHNVLIAMQKEFHCPYVGTHKLCGTFEKGPHQPCANGQNNSVFVIWFSILYVFVSAVEFSKCRIHLWTLRIHWILQLKREVHGVLTRVLIHFRHLIEYSLNIFAPMEIHSKNESTAY